VYRTDTDGTILVRSNGETYSITTEREDAGIWAPAPVPTTTTTTTSVADTTSAPATTRATTAIPITIPTVPPDLTIPVPSITIPPVQAGDARALRISAVQFDAPGDDRQNVNGEWVRIANGGSGPVLLAGWTLSDKDTPGLYTFPAFVLLPESTVTVYAGSGMMNETSLFMGKTEPVFANSGDEAVLRDGSGVIIDRSAGR